MLNSLESSTHDCEAIDSFTYSAVDQCSIKEETFERRIAFELQFYAQLTSQSPFAVSWFLPKATGGLIHVSILETSNFTFSNCKMLVLKQILQKII